MTSCYRMWLNTSILTTFPMNSTFYFDFCVVFFFGSYHRELVRNVYFWFAACIKLYAAAASMAGRPELHAVGTADWVKRPLRTVTSSTARWRIRTENKITAGKTWLWEHWRSAGGWCWRLRGWCLITDCVVTQEGRLHPPSGWSSQGATAATRRTGRPRQRLCTTCWHCWQTGSTFASPLLLEWCPVLPLGCKLLLECTGREREVGLCSTFWTQT